MKKRYTIILPSMNHIWLIKNAKTDPYTDGAINHDWGQYITHLPDHKIQNFLCAMPRGSIKEQVTLLPPNRRGKQARQWAWSTVYIPSSQNDGRSNCRDPELCQGSERKGRILKARRILDRLSCQHPGSRKDLSFSGPLPASSSSLSEHPEDRKRDLKHPPVLYI